MKSSTPHKSVLLVDDNPGDLGIWQRAFRNYGQFSYRIYSVADGVAALAFLRQEGLYAGMPCPDLVLLDIGLPSLTGWEVLATIRTLPTLASLPVVMLTGTMMLNDEEQRAVLQPTACIEKPMRMEKYPRLVADLEKLLD